LALKTFRPTSPGRRGMVKISFDDITKTVPEKALLVPKKRKAGRNSRGVITTRHRGGGAKQKTRIIDFKRDKLGVPGKVAAIEYDPGRTARIALIFYADGEKRYMLCPLGVGVGDTVQAGGNAEVKPGNNLPLGLIPAGTAVHNLEFEPNKGGQIVRSAGASAQILGREDKYTMVRLPSGEVRRFLNECRATIGQVGNLDHQNTKHGKAGRVRLLGRRPKVRGSAMSPRDHPHGGGEGRSPRGMHPKTPQGKPALGHRTRVGKVSDRLIVRRRYAAK